MTEKLETLVVGAGERGNAFVENYPKKNAPVRVTGVADPNSKRRKSLGKKVGISPDKLNIPAENRYEDGKGAIDSGKFDAVYIATQDEQHKDLAIQALDKNMKGVLLEKPIDNTPQGCIDIVGSSQKSDSFLAVFHPLRYSSFFQTINDFISSGELGNVKKVDLKEEINKVHYAHSYVRGNWKHYSRSPFILAKSCHDLQELNEIIKSTPEFISSIGGSDYFIKENAPEGALERCTDGCPAGERRNCDYDARKIYLDLTEEEKTSHPFNTISDDISERGRKRALEETDYGECVFKNTEDGQCDWQDVNILYENGVVGNFNVRVTNSDDTRRIKVVLETGEIEGDLAKGNLTITYNDGRKENIDTGSQGSHGGGDEKLIADWANRSLGRRPDGNNLASPENILGSHLMAFGAEKSRVDRNGGRINFQKYLGGYGCEKGDGRSIIVPY